MTKRRLAITEHPSPNFNERPDNADIDMLVIHYTGMPSAEAAIEWLAHPASRVSAHYLIDEDGRVVRMVEEEKRAWHAGVSHWRGRDNVNDCSIGIELVNPGHEWGYRPFPEAQMAALEALAADICARHRIPPTRVVGHADVAPGRKTDPGELFDWARLARAGIAKVPEHGVVTGEMGMILEPGQMGPAVRDVQDALRSIGYYVGVDGTYDAMTRAVVMAFQQHFHQHRVDGLCDSATAQRIFQVLDLFA